MKDDGAIDDLVFWDRALPLLDALDIQLQVVEGPLALPLNSAASSSAPSSAGFSLAPRRVLSANSGITGAVPGSSAADCSGRTIESTLEVLIRRLSEKPPPPSHGLYR